MSYSQLSPSDRGQSPAHIISAKEKVKTFVSPFSAFDCLMLTRGWLNAVEGDQGIAGISIQPALTITKRHLLKVMCKGRPNASAMWQCAKAGGFEMIASAANGRDVIESGLYIEV